jgi:hypothetical protein
MSMKRTALAAAIAMALPWCVHAEDANLPSFKFSGFGTLGGVATNTDQAEYATSVLQSGGAKKSVDFGVDSVLAGQVDARATADLTFTGQLVANRTADKDKYTPHVEWAFGRYALTRDLAVRAGILAVPVFLQSDSRLVGFANPWVRTPTALYSQAPFTDYQGADLVYRHAFGDASLTVQPYYGRANPQIPSGDGHVTSHLDDLTGINVMGEMGAWTVRAGYFQSKFTYGTDQTRDLFAGLRQAAPLVPGLEQLADNLDPTNKKVSFASLGAAYDSGNIWAQAEYGKRKADFFLADTTAWYASFGYRFGNVMPHITYSKVTTDSPTSYASAFPPVPELAPLADGVAGLLSDQNPAQNTIAIGVRWQFARNADVKLQWDHVSLPAGAIGNFQNAQPGFLGSTVNVYSAAVDFVF